ncbi:class I SAM-dependent methyltransferase [Fructilactobacillus florum]|uniref:class I SAM-dependent methyltransferase n=1 Tax=Fructilactobacillus florum TaxID=640331 RepID=UPI00028C524F|nr:class I SAM-dependent methyltransferase [Fructilactobacillus florum]EKK20153.1 methyltransferase RlmI [Fructilactobacillus florum 2F]
MQEIEITGAAASKFEGGYPWIQAKDLVVPITKSQVGDFVILTNHGHPVASAYLAIITGGWVLSKNSRQTLDQQFFTRCFKRAFRKRQPVTAEQSTAVRLFNGSADGVGGMTVDNFAGEVLVTWENPGIQQQSHLLLAALEEALPEYRNLYELCYFDAQAVITAVPGAAPQPQTTVKISEAGTNYSIQLLGAARPGLYLEYRPVREQLKKNTQGKAVLNLLFYQTGLVAAAELGGAIQTENIEMKQRAQTDLLAEMEVNQLDGSRQKNRIMDLRGYLNYAQKHQLRFEVITIKLPAYFSSKKGNFIIKKDAQALLEQLADLAAAQADIFITTPTNQLSLKALRLQTQIAFKQQGRSITERAHFSSPADFPVDHELERESAFKGLWVKIVD